MRSFAAQPIGPSGTIVLSLIVLAALSLVLLFTPPALADGGAVQFSQRSGNLQFTVMTDPTPLRCEN